jgi:hypothetical protein
VPNEIHKEEEEKKTIKSQRGENNLNGSSPEQKNLLL